jgi:hypothetical protein
MPAHDGKCPALRAVLEAPPVLSAASADDDGVVVGGDVLRAEGSPADR